MATTSTPKLPIPISFVGNRYLLFDVLAVSWLRREHHICGVLLGTIPQAPQQNIFTGLPLALMPEEVRLLIEKRVAYVFDASQVHAEVCRLPHNNQALYVARLRLDAEEYAKTQSAIKERQRSQTLERRKRSSQGTDRNISATNPSNPPHFSTNFALSQQENAAVALSTPDQMTLPPIKPMSMTLTPATSAGLLSDPPLMLETLPEVPASYPLYSHLHSLGYYVSPGLRFGCQYMVYPGDPLRFHSHFLGTGLEWDDEFDLINIVAGSRLGTGVKKGFLIGGQSDSQTSPQAVGEVRTFSVEWAGM